MECSLMLLADYANTTADNKLNVMGIFTTINSVRFPTIHPQMYLIAQLVATPHEYGRRFHCEIKLINEDASVQIVPVTFDGQVPTEESGRRIKLNVVLALANIMFNSPGIHEFSLLINDDLKGTVPVELVQIPQKD